MSRLQIAVLFMACAAATSCSSEAPTYPVFGRVVFANRSPVKSGVIEFSPLTGGLTARSKIEVDGRFELRTGNRRGAVAGKHRVAVVQVVLGDGMPDHAHSHHEALIVHPKFARFDTSGLVQDVLPKDANEFVIVVEPGGGKRGGW